MSSKHKLSPQVEGMDSRVLLSGFRPMPHQFVDITGPVQRSDPWSEPRAAGRSRYTYNFDGSGGAGVMGAVQTSGTLTDTVRNGVHTFKGNLTLSNSQGSVRLNIRAGSYKIVSGTGEYRGATGIGAVSYGTRPNAPLVGLSFTADL